MGASRIRTPPPQGSYRWPVPKVLGGSLWGGRFLMSEVPLQGPREGCFLYKRGTGCCGRWGAGGRDSSKTEGEVAGAKDLEVPL